MRSRYFNRFIGVSASRNGILPTLNKEIIITEIGKEIFHEGNTKSKIPIEIRDTNGKVTYYEDSNRFWAQWERDDNGNQAYYEDSNGSKWGTPKSSKTCEGKVVEVDGIKYELKAL